MRSLAKLPSARPGAGACTRCAKRSTTAMAGRQPVGAAASLDRLTARSSPQEQSPQEGMYLITSKRKVVPLNAMAMAKVRGLVVDSPGYTVTVDEGDTFLEIAISAGCTRDELLRANGMKPRDIDSLAVGQTLRVPTKASNIAGTRDIIHAVKEGESLWDIAQDYGTTTPLVLQANNVRKGDSWKVQAGQRIIVPVPKGSRHGKGVGALLRGLTTRPVSGARPKRAAAAAAGRPAVQPGRGDEAEGLLFPLLGAALVVAWMARLHSREQSIKLQQREIWAARIRGSDESGVDEELEGEFEGAGEVWEHWEGASGGRAGRRAGSQREPAT